MDFDGCNFFPSAPGLLVDIATNPWTPKLTPTQVGSTKELMSMCLKFNKAKKEPVGKFFPPNVPRNSAA